MSKYMQSLLALVNAGQTTDGCLLVSEYNMNLHPESVCKSFSCDNCIFATVKSFEENIVTHKVIKILENSSA